MKNFFQRKHSNEAGPPKSASKDPYRIWEPRPETEVPQRTSGRSEKRDDRSTSRNSNERHRSSSRAPRQNDGDSVPPYASSSSTYKYPSLVANKDFYSMPTAATSNSRRAPSQYAQPTPRTNPMKLTSNDVSIPSYTNHINTAASNARPSLEGAANSQVYATSAMNGAHVTSSALASNSQMFAASTTNGAHATLSAPASGTWIPLPKPTSSSSKRPREREGERDRLDKYGERSRQRERDREREKGRDKDGDRVRERDRTREKEKERERMRRLEREAGSVAALGLERLREKDGTREKERQRDRDNLYRSSAKERDIVRERDYARDQERRRDPDTDLRARERVQSRETDKIRDRHRRPSDLDREKPLDMDRSSIKPRRSDAERDRDVPREYNSALRSSGKDSSDEGESSDASKRNYSSTHRRPRTRELSSSSWVSSAATHPSSVSALPHTVPPTASAPRPAPEYAPPVQVQYTPQPLPVHLPLKLPDQRQLQEASQPQDTTGSGAAISGTETKQSSSRRIERHTPSTYYRAESGASIGVSQTMAQQQQAQKASSKSRETSGRAYGDDRQAKSRLNQGQDMPLPIHALPESRERTNSGNHKYDILSKSLAVHNASEEASRQRSDVRAPHPYLMASHRHEATAPFGLPTPSRTSEQVASSGTGVIPSALPRPPRMEAPSTSQQASSSSGNPFNRREKEKPVKGNEDQSIPLGKDTRNPQVPESIQHRGHTDPTSSLLFHETQMGNPGQLPVSVPNNSPHASLHTRFTPPTPVKRSPAAETGQLLSGHGRMHSNSPIVLGRSATVGVPVTSSAQNAPLPIASGSSEMSRSRLDDSPHPLHKTSSHERLMAPGIQRPSNKVSQLIAGYEARSSPSTDKAGLVAPGSDEVSRKPEPLDNPSKVPSGSTSLENQASADVTLALPVATPMQSSPSFNVLLSTNERGRVISLSASNEDGPPARQASAGSNSGQLAAHSHLPGTLDTPSSKYTLPTPMMNVTNVISDTNQLHGSSWKSYPSTGTRGKEDLSSSSLRAGVEHPVAEPKVTGPSGAWNSRSEKSAVQTAVQGSEIPNDASNRREDYGNDFFSQPSASASPFVQAGMPPVYTGEISGGLEAKASRPANTTGIPPTTGLLRSESSGAVQASDRSNDALWQGKLNPANQVEPIERATSTLPFRHPKLAELLSDEAFRPPESTLVKDTMKSESSNVAMPYSQSLPRMPQERIPLSSTRVMPETSNSSSGLLPASSLRHSPTSYANSQTASQAMPPSQRQNKGFDSRIIEDNAPSYSYQAPRIDNAAKSAHPSSSTTYTSNATIPVSLPDRSYANMYGLDFTTNPIDADANMRTNTPAMLVRPPSTRPTEGAWTNTIPPHQSSAYSSNRARSNARAYEVTGSARSRVSQADASAQKVALYRPVNSSIPPSDALKTSLSEQESNRAVPSSEFQPAKEVAQPSVLPLSRNSPHKLARAPSEESILKTPSSLAPSVTISRSSIPASLSSQQESRKKGFLSIFRPKTSSQQQGQEDSHEVWVPPPPDDRYLDREIPLKSGPISLPDQGRKTLPSRAKVPPPIAVPIPIITGPDKKSPNHKVFTPFRYLTSKRNRTMSAASVEAVDGTAPNTVVGSPTASMHSSQPPIQPPPLRDAHAATQEWRKEAEFRNTRHRVQRPGVVFDVPQEPSEDKQNLKYVKTRGSRPSTSSR